MAAQVISESLKDSWLSGILTDSRVSPNVLFGSRDCPKGALTSSLIPR